MEESCQAEKSIVSRRMSSVLAGQFDFILFLYGLAFILLGSVCFSRWQDGVQRIPWLLLAGFAFAHGGGEWFDLIALAGVDFPGFEMARALLLGISFLALVEFARKTNRVLRGHGPGVWVDVALGAGVLLVTILFGRSSLVPSIRLLLATTGAVWAGWLFIEAAFLTGVSGEGPAARRALGSAGLALCSYGLAAGLFGPAAPFIPASWINQQTFLEATGVPIQLIRGLIAGWLTISLWAYAESFDQGGTVRRKRKLAFLLMVATLTGIQASGWSLTNYLGRLNEKEFVREVEATARFLTDHILLEMKSADETAHSLSAAASWFRLVDGPRGVDRASLDVLVDALSPSVDDRVASVLDSKGTAIAASNRDRPDSFLGHNYAFRPYFITAMKGQSGRFLGLGVTSRLPGYFASDPIRGEGGTPVGVVVVKRVLSPVQFGLDHFDNVYIVSPEGKVLLSSRREAEGQMLWPTLPVASPAPSSASPALPAAAAGASLLASRVSGTEWVLFAGKPHVAVRRSISETGWSLVLLWEERSRTTNRLLGVVVTLLFCVIVMTYFVAMQRQYGTESQLSKEHMVLKGLSRQLARKADTDVLTGVRNRFGFDNALAMEVKRARIGGTSLSIVMLDLDHFKQVNDLHGHKAGDEFLVGTARLLEKNVRQTDMVARWGGEEFMIISPLTPLEGAVRQAEKVRAAFAASPPGNVGVVSASFGVTSLRPADSIEQLLGRADEALYRAKSSGRNRVESAA